MSDNKDFVIENGVLKKYVGNDKNIIVPETVKTISSYAFKNSHELLTVTISNGTKRIDSYTFKDCTSLKKVILPETIEVIGDEAFRNCTNLKEFVFNGIPNKVGNLAFWGCWNLYESAESQPDFLKNFWTRIFSGTLTKDEAEKLYVLSKSKGEITIKDFCNVSFRNLNGSVYEYYFTNKEERLFIPCSIDGIPVVKAPCKNIPKNAVVYCPQEYFDKLNRMAKVLITVRWLSGDKLINERLTDKVLAFIKKYPEDVVSALEEIDDVQVIRCFFETAKVKPEHIEKLIKSHQKNAEITALLLELKNSSGIQNEDLSLDSVKKMTVSELKKIWTYETITYAETDKKSIRITNYKSKEKHVVVPEFIGKIPVSEICCSFPDYVESAEFPASDMKISCSFSRCKKMADKNGFICVNAGHRCIVTNYIGDRNIDVLNIPEGITENVYGSFRNLNIREVNIFEGFENLARFSFEDCKRLEKVSIPESMRTIGFCAFNSCSSLKRIYIPENVTNVEVMDTSHKNRKNIIIYGKKGSAAFDYAQKFNLSFLEGTPQETEAVPEFFMENGILDGYAGCGGAVEIPQDVEIIGPYAFNKNSDVNSVMIGNRVHTVKEYAFSGCDKLTDVKVCGNVKIIENSAFNFTGIVNAEIEEGVEFIGDNAFSFLLNSGATIRVPSTVTQIGEKAFFNFSNSTSLVVKSGSYAEQYAKENNIPFVAEE